MANFFDIKARKAEAAANGAANKKPERSAADDDQPWVEKYRPKTLDDIAAQDHTVTVLRRTLQSSNLPHMLFYGPPGTGKTSTVLALAKQLYGPEMIKSRVLELNASDERGISIVRDKVKNFARTQLIQPTAAYKQKYPCPPFKIIILDEADSMTQDAQSALRRTMETYSKITRFCLICNYVTRIIDPLASRCSKFRFKSLDEGNAKQRLEDIAKIEAVPLADGAVDSLISCSGGDLRKAITYLQSGCRIGVRPNKPGEDSMDTDPNPVTVAIVEDLAGVVPDRQMEGILRAIHNPANGGSYQKISAETTELVLEGWSAGQVIVQMFETLMADEAITDKHKSRLMMIFSEIDKRLVDGADEHLSMLDLSMRIASVLAGK